jgi:ligand-binding sensor domain-containing protein
MVEDREGNLWLGGDTTLLRWTARSHIVYQLPRPTTKSKGIHALASTSDGTLWVGIETAGLGLQRFAEGRWSSFKTQEFDSSTLTVESLYADRTAPMACRVI